LSQLFKGFKTTTLNLLLASFSFIFLSYFPQIWTPWFSLIEILLPITLIITAVFSAYFNHSRITLITTVFLLFYLSENFSLPWSDWLNQNETWFILSSLFLLAGLSFIKDRALISVHGFHRAFLFILFATLAYAWQYFDTWVINTSAKGELSYFQFITPWLHHLLFAVPAAFISTILLWKSFREASSFASALFITCLFFIGEYYQYINFPWQASYLVFAIYYLLVVIVESYFLAYRDDLTGLPSRRALNQLALSLSRKYSVAMLDIDHFKKFNDTYGHDVGDQVLKLVAARIGEVRGGGKAFRYGGEEFTVVFPRKNIEQVLDSLESVRQTIADYTVTIRNPERSNKKARKSKKTNTLKKVSVTISIGVATKEGKASFNEVLKDADKALYRAKGKGRNNVSE